MAEFIKLPADYDHSKSLHENRFRFRGTVRCSCGAEHELDRGDSDCEKCGQMFNGGGQMLRPAREWEEEY